MLTRNQCTELARLLRVDESLMWRALDDDSRDIEAVDFDTVQRMVASAREGTDRSIRERERGIQVAALISDNQFLEFREDLLMLHDMFVRYDLDGSGTLCSKEVLPMLREFGLRPLSCGERRDMEGILRKSDADGSGTFSFAEFLVLVGDLRSYMQARRRGQLQEAFAVYDRDGKNQLTVAEISLLLCDVGLVPKTRKEQEELICFMESVDADGSGTIDFGEFELLAQRIDEKLNSLSYEEQVEGAIRRGFSELQFRQLQGVFEVMDADGSGQLDKKEVLTALTSLDRTITRETFDSLYDEIDTNQTGHLDLSEFLEFGRMMRDSQGFFAEGAERLPLRAKDLTAQMLRRTIECFRLSKRYLTSLSQDELISLFCTYVDINPEDKLEKVLGVRTLGELMEIARTKDVQARRESRSSTV